VSGLEVFKYSEFSAVNNSAMPELHVCQGLVQTGVVARELLP
jgi:hypothetical protein